MVLALVTTAWPSAILLAFHYQSSSLSLGNEIAVNYAVDTWSSIILAATKL